MASLSPFFVLLGFIYEVTKLRLRKPAFVMGTLAVKESVSHCVL